jgi:hypothetical protein
MGTPALLLAAADAGLHVLEQWQHGDRTFIRASGARYLKETGCPRRASTVGPG